METRQIEVKLSAQAGPAMNPVFQLVRRVNETLRCVELREPIRLNSFGRPESGIFLSLILAISPGVPSISSWPSAFEVQYR